MDGRHLGAEKGVVLLHFLGEYRPVVSAGDDLALKIPLVPHAESGDQGADADAGRAQIVDLIDLQHGVDFAGAGEDIGHLVRGHGVQAAAKAV